MNDEITFLISLLLDHKMSKNAKMAISARLKDIQKIYSVDKVVIPSGMPPNINGTGIYKMGIS